MAAANQNNAAYVKKETVLLVAVVALVVGFLGGIVFSVYKSPAPPQPGGVPQQAMQQGQFSQEQARQMLALEQEVQTHPDNVNAWIELGHLYFDTNEPQKAIRAYEKALGLNPNMAEVWTDLGVMYRRSGQPQKALEAFDKAIGLNPTLQQPRFNKGIVYLYDLQQPDAAIQAWEELLKINPSATGPNGQPLRQLIEQVKTQQQPAQ